MTLKNVWLVVGDSGDCVEEARHWVVAAYLDEGQAREHARLAQVENRRVAENNPYDHWGELSKTDYSVVQVPFVLGLDDYLERPRKENEREYLRS